jgi:putative ABC transport system permease protein
MVESIWRDVVLAVRLLRKAPGYTLCATLMLALATGGATAVFSVVNTALLRPFPYLDTDRWANLYERPANEGLGGSMSASIPNYRDWKRDSRSFTELVLWQPWSFNISGDEQAPERLQATIVTPNLFRPLGLTPAAGRLLDVSDDPVRGRIVLISHGLWQRRFGGDPAIVGQTITLNLAPFTVVGVAPRDFTFPLSSRVDAWVPDSAQGIASATARDARGMQVSGLLRPGVTWEAARAEMDVIAARLAAQYPENKGFGVAIVPMRESIAGEVRTPLLALLGALGMVVLLVSVNIANLHLAGVEARSRELAVRAALGASRGRLIRQALMESLLVALAAGALGFALAPFCVMLLLTFVPADHLPWLSVSTDRTVLLAAIGFTSLVTLLCGVLPALRGTRLDLSTILGRGSRTTTATPGSRRLRHASIVAQLALSLVLIVGAALLIQSFMRLQRVSPGFSTAGRMTLSYTAPRLRYQDSAKLASLADRIREQVAHTPGVLAAGVAQALPFAPGAIWFQALTRTDPNAVASLAELPHVHYNVVSAGYAEALGVPLVSGRTFTAHDTATSPAVVVINQALASRFFPNEAPIGRSLWVGHAQALPTLPRRTVIGVVGDARWNALDTPAGPEAWIPFAQQTGGEDVFRTMYVLFRAAGDPAATMPAVRAQIRSVDRDLALTSIRTLESRLDDALWRERLAAAALGVLGVSALAIALLGVFGVTSYLAGRRAHEMGVRLALGARPGEIVRLMLTESGWLVLVGTLLGTAGAFALTRWLSSLLFGVSASDAPTFGLAAAGLAASAMLACYVPARRAARVDPLVTLRAE